MTLKLDDPGIGNLQYFGFYYFHTRLGKRARLGAVAVVAAEVEVMLTRGFVEK
jgi:hypothetical protein